MVLVAGGGYAEYVAAHMGCVMRIPEGISMVEAGGESFHLLISHTSVYVGIPEVYLTAFQGLRLIANMKKDDLVLIHAGAR